MDTLEIENDLVRSALMMKIRIDDVIIIDHVRDADKILRKYPYLVILPMDARSVITSHNGTINSKPIYPSKTGDTRPG